MSDRLPPPPPPQRVSQTFSGLDHRRDLERARMNDLPEPSPRDPLKGDTDPAKAAYLAAIKE